MIREGDFLWPLYRRLYPKQVNYKQTFGTPQGEAVLRDLAVQCHACSPAITEREMGKRDVWLRINAFLHLTDGELTMLFAALTPEQRRQIYKPGPTFTEDE